MIVKKIGKKNKNALLTIKDTINLLSYTKFYFKKYIDIKSRIESIQLLTKYIGLASRTCEICGGYKVNET